MSVVVVVTPETHPRDVGDLGLRFGSVVASPMAGAAAHGFARMLRGGHSLGGYHAGISPVERLNWAPRDADESFAEFGARCRRAFLAAGSGDTALVVTHPRNLALCLAYALYGEAGLHPSFDYVRAEGATSFTGVLFTPRPEHGWATTLFGR
jgi:hypothetical protein